MRAALLGRAAVWTLAMALVAVAAGSAGHCSGAEADRIGKQDGTLYNPVIKPVVSKAYDSPQPALRYPAPRTAGDCEQYRMPDPSAALPDKGTQEGGPDTLKYQRRTVVWLPREGQDIVKIPDGVKLRRRCHRLARRSHRSRNTLAVHV